MFVEGFQSGVVHRLLIPSEQVFAVCRDVEFRELQDRVDFNIVDNVGDGHAPAAQVRLCFVHLGFQGSKNIPNFVKVILLLGMLAMVTSQ